MSYGTSTAVDLPFADETGQRLARALVALTS